MTTALDFLLPESTGKNKLLVSETWFKPNTCPTSNCQQKFSEALEAVHHFNTKPAEMFVWDLFVLIHLFIKSRAHFLQSVIKFIAVKPLHAYGNINWVKLGRSLPLDDLPYTAKCYCVSEVLHTSCPASQSSFPKLLSSVYPPSGTSVGGSRVGGSIRLGGYWREWMWLELEIEVLQLEWRRATTCKAEKMWEYKWKILSSSVPNSVKSNWDEMFKIQPLYFVNASRFTKRDLWTDWQRKKWQWSFNKLKFELSMSTIKI